MMWKPLKKERTNPYIRNLCVAVILEKLEIYFYFNGILSFSNKLKGELYCALKYQNKGTSDLIRTTIKVPDMV